MAKWWNRQTQRTQLGRYIGNDIVVSCKFKERFNMPTLSQVPKGKGAETIISYRIGKGIVQTTNRKGGESRSGKVKSVASNGVRVQVPPSLPFKTIRLNKNLRERGKVGELRKTVNLLPIG